MSGELANAVNGPAIQPGGPVWLRLQADTDVFNGAGDGGVGNAGEGAGQVVLSI